MHSPIRISLIFIVVWAALAIPAVAETKYIAESFEITLRTGPGTDRKIIAMIPAGKQVEIVHKGDDWSEVTYNGKQGFVLTRYLTDELPTSLALERLQNRHNGLLAKNTELQTRSNELTNENKQLKETLSKTQNDLSGLTTEHETLRQGSSEYLSLREKYDQVIKDLSETRAKAESFESQVNKLSHKEFTEGMLYGGGILVFGVFMGLIFRRPKRKTSLL